MNSINVRKIKKEMEFRGWKSSDLAKAVGLPRQNIYYLFKAESCSVPTLERLARALGLEVKDLL